MVQSILAPANGKRSDTAPAVDIIVHALSILAEPGQAVELRIPGLNGKRTDSGYFTDPEKLARAALSYNGRAEGIYITLNPLNPALLARSSNRMTEYAKATTGDKDIAWRRWLFLDFDPVRPAGISSSDVEHEAALRRAEKCREWLQTHGIPAILADSGNGAHLLIPIRLPNAAEILELLKQFLAFLSMLFSDTEVELDTSTINASRIIKLYGTVARKGDNVAERPHRQASLLVIPATLDPVERGVLETILTQAAEQKTGKAAPAPGSDQPVATTAPKTATLLNDRSLIDQIKAQFDMVAYAESRLNVSAVPEGKEYRLPGNKGFLICPEQGCWYHHGGQMGGDALDLVGYLLEGTSWNPHDKPMFRKVLQEAAAFANVVIPKKTRQSKQEISATNTAPDAASAQAENAPPPVPERPKLDLMDAASIWKHRYADELAWDVKSTIWRRWTGTHWKAERENETLDLHATEVLRAMGIPITNVGKLDGVIRLARVLCKRDFKASPLLVNFQNGTLDLATMTGHRHTAEDNLTECLPYDYTPKGNFPTIEHFLKSAIPDSEGQRAYMAHVGLALINDHTLHKALVLLGPPRSGKTTLLKLAQLVLGVSPGQFPTAVLFSPESRGANSRATWIDHSPRLVCLDEFPEEALRDEGEELFKSMTAHGGVSMWLKYRDERAENAWTPKLLFATNNRMRYRDPSGALTRRLLIVECPYSLPDSRLDSTLLHKFEPEFGAFAAACLQLALEVQSSQVYPESVAMRALLADIERSGDAVKLWLSENCTFEASAFIPTHTLYLNFKGWCEDNGLHSVSRPKLRDMVCGAQPDVRTTRQRVIDPSDGMKKLCWGIAGIRLRTPADDQSDEA